MLDGQLLGQDLAILRILEKLSNDSSSLPAFTAHNSHYFLHFCSHGSRIQGGQEPYQLSPTLILINGVNLVLHFTKT